MRSAIELLEKLRTKCATLVVLRWSVGKDKLGAMTSDCLRVIQRLEPKTATDIRNLEEVLREIA